ncbi:MAG: hypothetical protein GY851_19740 [bacterium]|nr:hypothetical protein [bacterium]
MTKMRYNATVAVVAMLTCAAIVSAVALSGRQAVAATDRAVLPPEIFEVGAHVKGQDATYAIEEVRGGWIRVRPYRSLDQHDAPPHVSRWIYVPAVPTPWSRAVE